MGDGDDRALVRLQALPEGLGAGQQAFHRTSAPLRVRDAGSRPARAAAVEDHLRALRDVSGIVNERSGKVVHELVSDGSVYFGSNDSAGNTDETATFPSAVVLV